jgi:hypothetical protein
LRATVAVKILDDSGRMVHAERRAWTDPLAPLVVASGAGPRSDYVVIHRASGTSVAVFSTIKGARLGLATLLPLCDWTRDSESVASDPGLFAQIRAIRRMLPR